jgi:hypothetical protein
VDGVYLCDEVQLLHVVLAREERLAVQQLSHDAGNRPGRAGQQWTQVRGSIGWR